MTKILSMLVAALALSACMTNDNQVEPDDVMEDGVGSVAEPTG